MRLIEAFLKGSATIVAVRVVVTLAVLVAVVTSLCGFVRLPLAIVAALVGGGVLAAIDARTRAGKAIKAAVANGTVLQSHSAALRDQGKALQAQSAALQANGQAAKANGSALRTLLDRPVPNLDLLEERLLVEVADRLAIKLATKEHLSSSLERLAADLTQQQSAELDRLAEHLAIRLATKGYMDELVSRIERRTPDKDEVNQAIDRLQSTAVSAAHLDESLTYFRDAVILSLMDRLK